MLQSSIRLTHSDMIKKEMIIMKKIIALILCVGIMAGIILPVSAETGEGVLTLLSEFNIMSGDPDGNLRLDDYVSRAEFTKIAVASSAYKNSVATNLAISPFPDVTYKHWAAPYVRVGVTCGIVSGYPDATFKPEDTVLYEEAITMLLRVLGYTDDDFGVSWPAGQIGLAENLDMTENVDCSAGELMNRRQVAQLVYNTLKTKQKNSSSDLLSVFDAVLYEDVSVIASGKEDSTFASDELFTSNGVYKIKNGMGSEYVGMSGDVIIKDSNRIVAFVPDTATDSEEYTVYSALGDNIMVYRDNSMKQMKFSDDVIVYKGKTQMTYGSLKTQLELGDRLSVRRTTAGDIDYITYKEGDVAGPVTAYGGNWQTLWNTGDNVTVTRDGAIVNSSAVQNYDILYYLADANIVFAYTNKVTGLYEKATPNRDMPVSVTVSGKEYELEGSTAFNKLYSGGEFEYGDTVTLLLGRDNKIADVMSPSASTEEVAGYLIETGQKEYASGDIDTFVNYYIKLVQPDGTEYEYVTDKDYTESVNSVVELSFSGGYARIKRVDVSGDIKGKFDWDAKRIGSCKISPNVQIIDVGTRDITHQGIYVKVYGQRLDGIEIKSDDIIYSEKNEEGEVTKLIMDNVTNDAFNYGIVTDAPGATENTGYSYIVDGSRHTLKTQNRYSVAKGDAVKLSGSLQNPDIITALYGVKNITSISTDKLVAENKTHRISDKVSVYRRESAYEQEYSMISLDEVIKNKSKYDITAYYDKSDSLGGRIRVILVREK